MIYHVGIYIEYTAECYIAKLLYPRLQIVKVLRWFHLIRRCGSDCQLLTIYSSPAQEHLQYLGFKKRTRTAKKRDSPAIFTCHKASTQFCHQFLDILPTFRLKKVVSTSKSLKNVELFLSATPLDKNTKQSNKGPSFSHFMSFLILDSM